jgi:glycosyltransferase involved in cell wall biosynthesis
MELGREMPFCRFAVVALPMFLGASQTRVEQSFPNRVRFLTNLTDHQLKNLYQEATIMFLPLKDAGANNALLESMACGLPAVITDLPAAREYAADCALYYNQGNRVECLANMRFLLKHQLKCKELAVRSRQRAEQFFGWEIIARQYEQLYADVLQPSCRTADANRTAVL